MNPFGRMIAWIKPRPKTPDDIEAEHEAERLKDEMQTIRLSQRSSSGANYQSGRGSGQ